MVYLLLSIGLSVLLLLNFRLFPRFGIDTFQAIVFNYPVCFLTGYTLLPAGQSFSIDITQTWTWLALGLGVGFIITFLLSGASTQRMGVTITSLANNLSLVIPVCFSLFVFGTQAGYDGWNYLGLVLAVAAVGLSTYRAERPAAGQTNRHDVWLPVTVFLLYGITNTMINYITIRYIPSPDQTVRVTLTMVLGAIEAGAFMWLIRAIRGQVVWKTRNLIAALTLGIPNFLSFYTLLLALKSYDGNGALVYPLYNIGVIVLSSAVGWFGFHERLSNLNRVGLGLALLALALISHQSLFGY